MSCLWVSACRYSSLLGLLQSQFLEDLVLSYSLLSSSMTRTTWLSATPTTNTFGRQWPSTSTSSTSSSPFSTCWGACSLIVEEEKSVEGETQKTFSQSSSHKFTNKDFTFLSFACLCDGVLWGYLKFILYSFS